MLKRDKRSALIITSSFLAQKPTPGLVSYSSTKAAVTFFAEALSYEVDDKIDVMGWDCGSVVTKANCFQEGGINMSPKQAVDGCFRDIGYERKTWGALGTEINGFVIKRLPISIFKKAMLPMADNIYLK